MGMKRKINIVYLKKELIHELQETEEKIRRIEETGSEWNVYAHGMAYGRKFTLSEILEMLK